MTEQKKDLGIGQQVDPEWLKIEENIRRDVEWAIEAGKGKFIVACWAVLPAGECDPKTLPADVVLPRDKHKTQVVRRINAFFPYSDMTIALRQFKEFLSTLIRQKHQQELKDLAEAAPAGMEGPPKLALVAPPEEAEPEHEGPSDDNGQSVPAEPEALGS